MGFRLGNNLLAAALAATILLLLITQPSSGYHVCRSKQVLKELRENAPRDVRDDDVSPRPLALVWQGSGVCAGCEMAVFNMLKALVNQQGQPLFTVKYTGRPSCDKIMSDRRAPTRDAISLSKENLDRAVLFAIGGGMDVTTTFFALQKELKFNKAVDTNPRELIQNFLTEKPNKMYLGLCLGAYMAGAYGNVGFNLLPIKPSDSYLNIIVPNLANRRPYKYAAVPGLVPVNGNSVFDDQNIWIDWFHPNNQTERLRVFFQDGNYFNIDPSQPQADSIRILARYINERGVVPKAVAAMVASYVKPGKPYVGKVGGSGVHIEAEDSDENQWWNGDEMGKNSNPLCTYPGQKNCGNRWNLGQELLNAMMNQV